MKRIINCETGEVTDRELNKAEKDQQKIDEASIVAAQAEAEAKAQAKLAAEGKLAALGLTTDDLRALGL
jgi:hypothetical protein